MHTERDAQEVRICIVNTGGTVSCAGDPLSPVPAAEFSAAAARTLGPVLARRFPGTSVSYAPALAFAGSEAGMLDSTNLQPADWCRIARFILDHYRDYDGFVVLHGTDTMAYSAAALPFLLNVFDAEGFARAALSKPVVLTGSQVPLFDRDGDGRLALGFNTDAFQNVCGAVAAARLGIPEVAVYFNSSLFRGPRVVKVDAGQFRAFASPNDPPLAACGIDFALSAERLSPGPVSPQVSLDADDARALALAQLDAVAAAIAGHPVMPLCAFPAAYDAHAGTAVLADLIDACVGRGIAGLILESYGEGNFPSGNPAAPEAGAVFRALKRAVGRGVTVINCTQVFAGTVEASAYAAGAWLPGAGALGAADMTATAALAKLTVLLSAAGHHGWDRATVEKLMQLALAGEMDAFSRLDSRRGGVLLPGQSLAALDSSARLVNSPRRGPRLISASGEILWTPFPDARAGRPGRLTMQSDGDLVLCDEGSAVLWASGTKDPGGAASVLMLSGSAADGTLELSVYDYSRHRRAATLYAMNRA